MKKILILFFFFANLANSLTFDIPPCSCKKDEVVYQGTTYTTFNFFVHFYSYVLTKKYGDVPPGLYIKSIVKDSLIYFVEAGVCFEESEDYKYPAGDTLTRIPMNVLFPEARSDTVKADFLTTYLELIGPEGSLDVLLIVKKGKIIRSYVAGTPSEGDFANDKEYCRFQRDEAEECNSSRPECEQDSTPEFTKLMTRLKPYYGEKRWKTAQKCIQKIDLNKYIEEIRSLPVYQKSVSQ